jgi:hypothetical protein
LAWDGCTIKTLPWSVKATLVVAELFKPIGDSARRIVGATGSSYEVLSPEVLLFAAVGLGSGTVGAFWADLFGANPFVIGIAVTTVTAVAFFLRFT